MARPVLSFVQKSKKWADKEHLLLSAYRSGVAGGTADFMQLVIHKTRVEQMVNVTPAVLENAKRIVRSEKVRGTRLGNPRSRGNLIRGGLRLNGSQIVNRTHATEHAFGKLTFNKSDMGIVTGKNQDGNIFVQFSPVTGKFVGLIEVTGKVGVAMKVLINKYRIRILTAGASKVLPMWKKMVAAGLQQNMQKRFGALN